MDDKSQDKDPADVINILVASDIHLGYGEKDVVREHDSFIAFEEVLINALKHDVDFILLGGDLFHESKPSLYCVNRCMQLIKRYCFGDKVISMEFLSQGFENLRNTGNVNYEDPNLNISFPIFSIHGNHDDLTGNKQVSAVDLLSTTGLVNYFGQWSDLKEIEIVPLIIRKGNTNLALYGLSHIHDQRLARLFHDNKVIFKPPPQEGYFHVLVLHQNRANRGAKNFIPIECLPDFLDLVIWGHEHDCIIEPLLDKNIFVCQPGSTVATSLSAGEALSKHCGLLLVHKTEFVMRPQPLRTVRPFVFDSLDLTNQNDDDEESLSLPLPGMLSGIRDSKLQALVRRMGSLHPRAAHTMHLVIAKLDKMIEEALREYEGPSKPPPLPLIRLQVKYVHDYQTFNTIQLGQHYNGVVANPEDMVKLKEAPKWGTRANRDNLDLNIDIDENADPLTLADNIESVIRDYFKEEANQDKLIAISADSFTKALTQFVKNDDNGAFEAMFQLELQSMAAQLKERCVPEEDIFATMQQISKNSTAINKLEEKWQSDNNTRSLVTSDEVDCALDDDDLDELPINKPSTSNTTKRSSLSTIISDDVKDFFDDDVVLPSTPSARGRGRGGRSRGPRRASKK